METALQQIEARNELARLEERCNTVRGEYDAIISRLWDEYELTRSGAEALAKPLENKEKAWKKYLAFVDMGGTCTFEELVEKSGLTLPYAPKCMEHIATKINEILVEKGKKL